MQELLIGGGLWLVLDVALLALWLNVARGRTRRHTRAMVRADERYANDAGPLAAALNSGHAEDPEIRHSRRRTQGAQAEFKPL
jgi:hypothetical protein